MSFHHNPFIRGYWGLDIQRVLEITHDEASPPVYRPLHSSQARLSDEEAVLRPCLFGADFALITPERRIARALREQCRADGFVQAVRYAMHGVEVDGQSVHLGDALCLAQANEVIRRLTFRTGFYSRSWEISTWHLDRAALEYLDRIADAALPLAAFFHVFRLPDGIIGMKLIGTPWNDAHLREIDGTTVARLRQKHRADGMPASLAHVLHLAGEADVRILIFDGGAPRLDDLPTYDHD
ncbi:MAG: ABC transporter substrate-binding protein [Candidatus Accumulibacter sp.]|jgi:hypothetical protein|nr:ABC transporter substrate-binding protein [Accumulibacter sp.]